MGSVLVGLIAMGIVALIFFKEDTYYARLEKYVASKNPTNTYDVERYIKEFEKKNAEGFL